MNVNLKNLLSKLDTSLLRLHMIAALLPFLTACEPTAVPTQGESLTATVSEESPTPSSELASSASSEPTVSLSVATWDEIQTAVQNHVGKIVVVDLWSTWCIPCVREFPGLVRLHKSFPDTVVCMSVNMNFTGAGGESPEGTRAEVETFLRKQHADFPNYLCGTPDLELYDKLELGAIPAVIVYGTDGKLLRRFDNDKEEFGPEGFSYEQDVEPFVRQLLSTSSGG